MTVSLIAHTVCTLKLYIASDRLYGYFDMAAISCIDTTYLLDLIYFPALVGPLLATDEFQTTACMV